ncbi:DUF1289 domain-containing protein [Roseibium litorale]|uniref:DUF1289 domain-containing protein n=1 Tax=Roseibium litorale TaxID=2803841 RepID=A0ABR9CR94_9HYPH|nr:DUF1289 domain-containing protein [Roseibium litorale]MBD8893402.1 DUF1289 domain-containing protein [Roseibium litorale]
MLSPCTKICQIDPKTRLCLGCLRSLEEIGGWSSMSDAQRQKIMAGLPDRRQNAGLTTSDPVKTDISQ